MRTARPVDQTGHPLGVEPGHPPVRALTGHAQLPGDVGDRATVHPNPLDQQPPAMERQASVSVRHEDLRSVETSDISTTPEVLPSRQQPPPTSWPSTPSPSVSPPIALVRRRPAASYVDHPLTTTKETPSPRRAKGPMTRSLT